MNATWGKRRAILRLGAYAAMTIGTALPVRAQTPPITWGIAMPQDARSAASLRENAARLDAVVSGWIQLDSVTGLPSRPFPDEAERARSATPRLALVTSWQGERFHSEMLRRLAADRGALALTAARVASLAEQGGYRGIVLDVRQQSREDLPLTQRFVSAIADSVRAHGIATVAMTLPAGDSAAYPTRAFFPSVDYLMIMLVDEHHATSAPGPVASPAWVRRMLSSRVADVGAKRVIAALPLYGFLWRQNQPGQLLSYGDAQRACAESAVELARDPATRSLHAVKRADWDLWMTDATLLRALRDEVAALGVTHVALWRLGDEDPGVWSVFAR